MPSGTHAFKENRPADTGEKTTVKINMKYILGTCSRQCGRGESTGKTLQTFDPNFSIRFFCYSPQAVLKTHSFIQNLVISYSGHLLFPTGMNKWVIILCSKGYQKTVADWGGGAVALFSFSGIRPSADSKGPPLYDFAISSFGNAFFGLLKIYSDLGDFRKSVWST